MGSCASRCRVVSVTDLKTDARPDRRHNQLNSPAYRGSHAPSVVPTSDGKTLKSSRVCPVFKTSKEETNATSNSMMESVNSSVEHMKNVDFDGRQMKNTTDKIVQSYDNNMASNHKSNNDTDDVFIDDSTNKFEENLPALVNSSCQTEGRRRKKKPTKEVANPPEQPKDDTTNTTPTAVSKNGQLARTGSVTVLRRRNSRKSSIEGQSSTPTTPDSEYANDDLGTEKLPSIDTPEASHVCSVRLRHILRRLEKDDIPKADLLKNLKYAASVLETVYIDETRRLCDEDDELSEVEPDAVPSEVRDWLALTFTRSMSNMKRRGNDKPRFRSVANAIRAGIMVDKIYRRMSSTVGLHVPPSVVMLLKSLDDWSFNVFNVNEVSENHSLKFVGYELLQRYDLITKFKLNTTTLENFFNQLETGYSKHQNPYHNLTHGADVAQTVHCVLTQSKLAQWLTDLEVFATLVAALIHDYEHTGTTNNFHIMTMSDFALLYNDRSVLENHHISSVFTLFKNDEYNILSGLKSEDFREFRSLVIDMVLATDMSSHFQQIKNMKHLLGMPENIDKAKALALVVHCCDISHPGKQLSMHTKWTDCLLEEFFRQGDRENELGLPFSPLCDRHNTLVAQSQIGFIDFIVDPSFQVMGDMLDKIIAPLNRHATFQKLQSKEPITEESFEKVDRCTSTTTLNDGPDPTKPPTPVIKFMVSRPWEEHLMTNKQYWKDRAYKDDNTRRCQSTISEASHESESDDATSNNSVRKTSMSVSNTDTANVSSAQKTQRTRGDKKLESLVKGMEAEYDSNLQEEVISRGTSTTGLLNFSSGLSEVKLSGIKFGLKNSTARITRRSTSLGLTLTDQVKTRRNQNGDEDNNPRRPSSASEKRAQQEVRTPPREEVERPLLITDDVINQFIVKVAEREDILVNDDAMTSSSESD